MNKTELTRTVKEMIAAPSCCQELKAAGQNYLNALGTDAEKAAAAALLQEIREDVCTLDQTIPFFESELGAQIFGAERAEAMAAHAREIKERVVLHCDRAVLDDVLDRFGTDIQVFERNEQTFTAVLTTPPRGVRFWALQYLSFVEVAEPAWLRQEIIEVLKVNHYLT